MPSSLAWGRYAERAQRLLVKGHPVMDHGEKRTRVYTDAKGQSHHVLELVASDFQVLAHSKESAGQGHASKTGANGEEGVGLTHTAHPHQQLKGPDSGTGASFREIQTLILK